MNDYILKTSVEVMVSFFRFLFGKNRIMAHALGRTESEEIQPNLNELASKISGQCGLLFTNRKKEEVIRWESTAFINLSLVD